MANEMPNNQTATTVGSDQGKTWHFNSDTPPEVSGSEISPTAYSGSMQEILGRNTGNYVICEFLIGTQNLTRKEGILYSVGVSFLTLYDPYNKTYMICDFYSLKFVTFIDPNTLNKLGIRLNITE